MHHTVYSCHHVQIGHLYFSQCFYTICTQLAASYQYFGSKTSYFVNENTDVRSVEIALTIFANTFDQVLVEAPKLIHYLHLQL